MHRAPALQAKLPSLPQAPTFNASFTQDCKAAQDYVAQAATSADGSAAHRQAVHDVKEALFRRHATAIYDALTDNCSKALRVNEIVYGAAERFPDLLPTRAQ